MEQDNVYFYPSGIAMTDMMEKGFSFGPTNTENNYYITHESFNDGFCIVGVFDENKILQYIIQEDDAIDKRFYTLIYKNFPDKKLIYKKEILERLKTALANCENNRLTKEEQDVLKNHYINLYSQGTRLTLIGTEPKFNLKDMQQVSQIVGKLEDLANDETETKSETPVTINTAMSEKYKKESFFVRLLRWFKNLR